MSKDKTIKTEWITAASIELGDLVMKGVKIDEGSPEANAEALKNLMGMKVGANISSKKLSEIISEYVQDCESNETWKEKTKLQNIDTLNILIEIIGDIQFSSLSHDNLRKFGTVLSKLPANRNKKREYKGRSIKQLIKLNPVPMNPTTVKNHYRRIKTFFRWSVNNGIISTDYSTALRTPKKNNKQSRRPFTEEELTKLFNGYIYKGEKPRGAHKWHNSTFWLPLIALYTGARIEEISQLYLNDIKIIDNIYCFDFNDDNDDKNIKTTAGNRLTPIHSELIRIGFLDFIRDIKNMKHKRLFPELKKVNAYSYGHQASKQFKTYREKMGIISNNGEPAIVFHSFRNTVTSLLAHKGIHEEDRSAITGHETGKGVNSTVYTDKFPPTTTHPIVETIQYGINLEHISYVWYKTNRHRWYRDKL